MQPIEKMSHGELSILGAAGKRVKLLSEKDLTMTAICINAVDGKAMWNRSFSTFKAAWLQSPLFAHSTAVRTSGDRPDP
jgi:hypothetical protein